MREMKNSGIEWIGEIPKEWTTTKIKHYCISVFAGGTPQSTNLDYWDGDIKWIPSGSYHDCKIYSAPKTITKMGYENISTKLIPAHTTLVAMTGATCGNTGFLTFEACANQSVTAYVANTEIADSLFLWYLLQSAKEHLLTFQTGGAQGGINVENCKNIFVPFVPVSEQQKLSAYLDNKCTKIDSIIEKQEKVIEKLKEYKLSVITEAVTKGLNPDVKMKDSGVEWIGEIPEHCKLTRAGHIFKIILGKMLSPTPKQDDDTFENYLCAANVHFTGISYEQLKQMWFSEIEKQIYAVQYGDLLVVEGGAGAGGAAIVEEQLDNCYIQNSIMIVRSKENVSNKWLYYTLYAMVKRNYVDFVCNKATIPHFTKDKLGNVPVVIFKKENETEIVNYLDKKCSAIDKSIEQKQAIIEKLKEYKKSLIYEVVTGKREIYENKKL